MLKSSRIISFFVALCICCGCTGGDSRELVETGKDECHTCKMMIMDLHFGGEAVTKTGKVFKFDSLNCLVEYYRSQRETVATIYVMDYERPGELVNASSAVFTTLENRANPMGSNLVSFATAEGAKRNSSSPLLSWEELVQNPAI